MLAATDRPSTRIEIVIGRSLALCVHPVAAWRSGSTAVRLHFVASYFVASYVLIFLALLLLKPSAIS
jgi:hypothetical protein